MKVGHLAVWIGATIATAVLWTIVQRRTNQYFDKGKWAVGDVLQFRPLSETLQDPFKPKALAQIALTTGLIVALCILWVQVLHPVGERLAKVTEEVVT